MPIVVTVDQKGSRTRGIQPTVDLLAALNDDPQIARSMPFAQAAGDEIQGVPVNAQSLIRVLALVARHEESWVGVGLGDAVMNANDVRLSTGSAFERARSAVGRAKKLPWGVAVDASGDSGARLDRAIALWYSVLLSRTGHGWHVLELRDQGLKTDEIAARLGVSPQAVTKAQRAANLRLDEEGRALVADLLVEAERAGR